MVKLLTWVAVALLCFSFGYACAPVDAPWETPSMSQLR